MLKNLKFHHKILLAASLVVIGAFSLFTLYNDYLQRNSINRNLDGYLNEMGQVTASNIESWLSGRILLVEAMKTDGDLREQAEANSQDQFLSSPTLKDALLLAVAETHGAHSRMTELFNEKGAVEKAMIELLGKLLYLDLHVEAGGDQP